MSYKVYACASLLTSAVHVFPNFFHLLTTIHVCMITMDDMSGATPECPDEVVVDCTGTGVERVVLQSAAGEVLFNRDGNLSLSVLTAAPVMPEEYTGEKSGVGISSSDLTGCCKSQSTWGVRRYGDARQRGPMGWNGVWRLSSCRT